MAGLRVLELADGIAGAVSGMYLADLGAEVISIDPPGGDRWSDQRAALCWDRGKTLAGAAPEVTVMRALFADADVVIVDAGAADLSRRRWDAVSVHSVNPSAVHVWLPAGGESGQWRDLPPDPVLQAAVTGGCQTTGQDPRIPPYPVLAFQQGLQGATAALAGVLGRERCGRAEAVVVSGLHALTTLYLLTLHYGVKGTNRTGGMPNYAVYGDRDGRPFAFCPLAPHFFFRALDVLDQMELMLLPGFDGVYERLALPEVATAITARLSDLFATQTREHWVSLLQAAEVPCAVVATTGDWLESDLTAGAGMQVQMDHPQHGTVVMPGTPVSFSATPTAPLRFARPGPAAFQKPGRPLRRQLRPEAGELLPPLSGLRVLDLGTFAAGPFGPMLLSGMGADVVKVEGPDGDPYRSVAISFFAVNRGKRSIALNLKSEQDRHNLFALVRSADVVMENFRHGVAARLGISGPQLVAVNPRLVHTSVTAWGDGPMADMPSFDLMVSAMSGLTDAGANLGLVHDMGTATLATMGTLAALIYRGPAGPGQLVTTTMARHSLMAQLSEATRCTGVVSSLDTGRFESVDDRLWAVTPQGAVPVLSIGELPTDDWVHQNRTWADVSHPDFGTFHAIRAPATWSTSDAAYGPTAPRLNEHGAEVLVQWSSKPPDVQPYHPGKPTARTMLEAPELD